MTEDYLQIGLDARARFVLEAGANKSYRFVAKAVERSSVLSGPTRKAGQKECLIQAVRVKPEAGTTRASAQSRSPSRSRPS
jgi:hypothetical protein